MEWLLLAAALGGGGGLGWTRWQRRVAERREQAADREVVRRLADEDVTVLGEQLRRLDERLAYGDPSFGGGGGDWTGGSWGDAGGGDVGGRLLTRSTPR